ncbi:MAG: hypothetical protein IMW93_07735 [Thermoanaerobacteraceae bacterium]|nr:hypothetical protein [Thermoanaerobacteraceae bacterium]
MAGVRAREQPAVYTEVSLAYLGLQGIRIGSSPKLASILVGERGLSRE